MEGNKIGVVFKPTEGPTGIVIPKENLKGQRHGGNGPGSQGKKGQGGVGGIRVGLMKVTGEGLVTKQSRARQLEGRVKG